MAISIILDGGITFDESAGVQDGIAIPVPALGEDNDDQDVTLSVLQSDEDASAFSDYLFVANSFDDTFATANGVGFGDLATVSTDGTPIIDVAFDFTDGASSGLFALDGHELSLYHDINNPEIVYLVDDVDVAFDPTLAFVDNILVAIYLDTTVISPTETDVDAWIVQFGALEGSSAGDILGTDSDEVDTLLGLSLKVSSSLEFDFSGAPPARTTSCCSAMEPPSCW